MNSDRIGERLVRLGERLARRPSVVDRVMVKVDCAEPVRKRQLSEWRILTNIIFTPRNLAAATVVFVLVILGLRPWVTTRENGVDGWWLGPRSAWAEELQAAIEKAGRRGFSCRERFENVTVGGLRSTSSTTSTLLAAGNQYRRDIYDGGRLRESQWYAQGVDGLTMTAVHYNDKTYTVTRDPKARQRDVDPMRQIEALAQLLDESGRRLGPARVEGQDAIKFEIAAKKIDAQADKATVHIWLDQATKMPLKITYQFAHHSGPGIPQATILVQDRFDWNPTLPVDAFEPDIPTGFTEVDDK